ncbi:hypothetical protein F53441_9603 [Fusarium austroafricanum]|uniref:Uncharacterized protein n=1 Tax=Fusarium austroafricanum TaxID=2364996 RepID=A0A8H4KAF1_9HYPO|nr:hypothetical protein F53441_9603 [Fusarium austroafricanum]
MKDSSAALQQLLAQWTTRLNSAAESTEDASSPELLEAQKRYYAATRRVENSTGIDAAAKRALRNEVSRWSERLGELEEQHEAAKQQQFWDQQRSFFFNVLDLFGTSDADEFYTQWRERGTQTARGTETPSTTKGPATARQTFTLTRDSIPASDTQVSVSAIEPLPKSDRKGTQQKRLASSSPPRTSHPVKRYQSDLQDPFTDQTLEVDEVLRRNEKPDDRAASTSTVRRYSQMGRLQSSASPRPHSAIRDGPSTRSRRGSSITEPKPGEVYTTYWDATKQFFAILILPWYDSDELGAELSVESSPLISEVPGCYKHNPVEDTYGWAKAYLPDGKKFSERKYLIMYFDEDELPGGFGWVHTSDIEEYNPHDNSIPYKSLVDGFIASRGKGTERQCLGCRAEQDTGEAKLEDGRLTTEERPVTKPSTKTDRDPEAITIFDDDDDDTPTAEGSQRWKWPEAQEVRVKTEPGSQTTRVQTDDKAKNSRLGSHDDSGDPTLHNRCLDNIRQFDSSLTIPNQVLQGHSMPYGYASALALVAAEALTGYRPGVSGDVPIVVSRLPVPPQTSTAPSDLNPDSTSASSQQSDGGLMTPAPETMNRAIYRFIYPPRQSLTA